ncbi:MAG: hypothetical protein AB9903_04990 [Vulcanimicrobiota bacterium]
MKSVKICATGLIIIALIAIISVPICASTGRLTPKKTQSDVVAVGSYYGYWGLNGYFINLLSQYFTMPQMQSIDAQIQEIAGIQGYGYNYSGEQSYGAYGYTYNPDNGGSWTYYGSGLVGMHYSELVNVGFYIDVDTATVVSTFTSTKDAAGGYASLIGKTFSRGNSDYTIVAARNWSPIVIDMDNNGIIDSNRNIWTPHAPRFFQERTAYFDITADGSIEYIEWLGQKDGLLVRANNDGSVTDAQNLFGTAGGYKDGYEKMAEVLDLDKNGWIEGKELEGLSIWRDSNKNAKSEPSELIPLQTLGIERISTSHKNFQSVYVMNGREYKTWDWWPSGFELMKNK